MKVFEYPTFSDGICSEFRREISGSGESDSTATK
jgi:hypothetical protein